jgi:hypothetical protein
MTFLHLLDRPFGQVEEFHVLAEPRRRRRRRARSSRYPVAASLITYASDAPGARLEPGHSPVQACGSPRFDTEALHHPIHQLGLP